MMKRFIAGVMALLMIISVCCSCLPAFSQIPTSYRFYNTQSYEYFIDTPYSAEKFCQQYIDPIKDKDDYTKAVLIIGIVCRQMSYDYSAIRGSNTDKVKANDLDNFFNDGRGICWCYSRAYCFFCRKAGLKAFEIIGYITDSKGNKVCHAWNAVMINGKRWFVDTCFIDTGASFDICFSNQGLPNHTFSYIY